MKWLTPSRIVAAVVALILVLGFLQVRSCTQAREKAAEARVERGQAGAGKESFKDAIATTGNVSAAQTAGEDLTRSNEKEIRDAKGADAAVDPGVRDAGLASLCRRAAYRDSERCRLRGTPAR